MIYKLYNLEVFNAEVDKETKEPLYEPWADSVGHALEKLGVNMENCSVYYQDCTGNKNTLFQQICFELSCDNPKRILEFAYKYMGMCWLEEEFEEFIRRDNDLDEFHLN